MPDSFKYAHNCERRFSPWQLISGQCGANLVEYVLLLAMILLAAYLAVTMFGTRLSQQYSVISSVMP